MKILLLLRSWTRLLSLARGVLLNGSKSHGTADVLQHPLSVKPVVALGEQLATKHTRAKCPASAVAPPLIHAARMAQLAFSMVKGVEYLPQSPWHPQLMSQSLPANPFRSYMVTLIHGTTCCSRIRSEKKKQQYLLPKTKMHQLARHRYLRSSAPLSILVRSRTAALPLT